MAFRYGMLDVAHRRTLCRWRATHLWISSHENQRVLSVSAPIERIRSEWMNSCVHISSAIPTLSFIAFIAKLTLSLPGLFSSELVYNFRSVTLAPCINEVCSLQSGSCDEPSSLFIENALIASSHWIFSLIPSHWLFSLSLLIESPGWIIECSLDLLIEWIFSLLIRMDRLGMPIVTSGPSR